MVDILFGIPAERVYKQPLAAAIYCGFEGRGIADSFRVRALLLILIEKEIRACICSSRNLKKSDDNRLLASLRSCSALQQVSCCILF